MVLVALLLWVGWLWAAPPSLLLGVLRPISFGVGVICESFIVLKLFQSDDVIVRAQSG